MTWKRVVSGLTTIAMARVCETCGAELPSSSRRSRRFCNTCRKQRQVLRARKWRDAHPEWRRANDVAYRKANRERIHQIHQTAYKKWMRAHPTQYASHREKYNHQRRARRASEKMASQKIVGPYRVKNIGAEGGVYEVVEMMDNTSNTWHELRPRKTYLKRESAYAKCVRLNRRWQEQLNSDEDDLLAYWQAAAN